MRAQLLRPDAKAQPNVAAANQRLIAVVGIYELAAAGYCFGQCVAGLVQAVSGRSSYANRKLVHASFSLRP